jgi:ABC-2 type transport system permease protein
MSAPLRARARAFYWSVRRELWEHPSLWMAPVAVVGVVLVGFLITLPGLPNAVRTGGGGIATPYSLAAFAALATAFLVAGLYCLAALHGERRDRSLLFWKSMPVSDALTVAAKAFVPLVAAPMTALVVAVTAQVLMLAISTLVLLGAGVSPALSWSKVGFPDMLVNLPYGLLAMTLWYAPVFGLLLLVSAWAQRTPMLWAAAPPMALCVLERLFGSTRIFDFLRHRAYGGFSEAFSGRGDGYAADPAKYLASPQLWIGLGVAVACLVTAARLRRLREPI